MAMLGLIGVGVFGVTLHLVGDAIIRRWEGSPTLWAEWKADRAGVSK